MIAHTSTDTGVEQLAENGTAPSPRARLLAALPVTERRLELAGISTSVLDGGEGDPIVLLHEPGSFAAHWLRVIPALVRRHRVVVPDLPGHGASEVSTGELDGDRLLAWVGELIERTCEDPPALVGHLGSGAIAGRFASKHGAKLRCVVLVDSLGLGRFRPAPSFALVLLRYVVRPTPRSYDGLMQRCTADFAGVRAGLGELWQPFADYTLDRSRSPAGKEALRKIMREVAVAPIPASDLERMPAATSLIWGRHDPVVRPSVAEAASRRYGWPLHVVDDAGDDPPIEQPDAFLAALDAALAATERDRQR